MRPNSDYANLGQAVGGKWGHVMCSTDDSQLGQGTENDGWLVSLAILCELVACFGDAARSPQPLWYAVRSLAS